MQDVAAAEPATFDSHSRANRQGQTVVAKLEGGRTARPWKLQLVGVKTVAGVKGGAAVEQPLGVVISPARGTRRLQVTLAGD